MGRVCSDICREEPMGFLSSFPHEDRIVGSRYCFEAENIALILVVDAALYREMSIDVVGGLCNCWLKGNIRYFGQYLNRRIDS